MSSANFCFLLNIINPKIKKKNYFFKQAIHAKERVAVNTSVLD
jgi:hypothetical protein